MDNVHNKKIDNDQKEIVDFLSFLKAASFNYLSLYSNKYFQWKIQNNPFGKSFSFISSTFVRT